MTNIFDVKWFCGKQEIVVNEALVIKLDHVSGGEKYDLVKIMNELVENPTAYIETLNTAAYEEGYDAGFAAGQDESTQAAYDQGYDLGYDEGHDEGLTEGRAENEND